MGLSCGRELGQACGFIYFTLFCSLWTEVWWPWKTFAPPNSKLLWKIQNTKIKSKPREPIFNSWMIFPPTLPAPAQANIFSLSQSSISLFPLPKSELMSFGVPGQEDKSESTLHVQITWWPNFIFSCPDLHCLSPWRKYRMTEMLFSSTKGHWIKVLAILNCTD